MINIKNVVVGIAILVLTIFVVVYGVGMFYSSPQYENFCGDKDVGVINTEVDCIAVGGQWTAYEGQVEEQEAPTKEGWCDLNYQCRQEFESAQEVYSRNVFFIALPIGIILIIMGVVLFGLEVVGAGLAGGGIGIILWGVGGYWRYGSSLLKFSLSLIGLVAVIWLAYWFNKRPRK